MNNERFKIFGCLFIIILTITLVTVISKEHVLYNNLSQDVISNNEEDKSILLNLDNKQIAATNFTYSVNNDLVSLYYANARTPFSVNKGADNYSSAKQITAYGGVFKSGHGLVSLKDGVYYFYAYDVTNGTRVKKGPVNVSGVCKNEVKPNQTSTFTFERCFIKKSNGSVTIEVNENMGSCAQGYKWRDENVYLVSDTCSNLELKGLSQRYCKRVYQATCVKDSSGNQGGNQGETTQVAAAKLSSLSTSEGALSPAFKSGTYKYNVSVSSNTSSIKIYANLASGSTFVSGYGPRTVKLNYGNNSVKVKVKNSAGKQTTYTITINRPDGRSSVNTLSNLKLSQGVLSPVFDSSITNYAVDVDNSVSSITVDATLTDNKSSFVKDFGPKTYNLEPGPNQIYVKVVSEKGATNVYNITVNRATLPSKCTTETETLALLKQINLAVDIDDLKLDQIEDFDSKQFTYNDIKVPYKVTNLTVEGYVETEGDTVLVTGADNLEVGETREIKITVTSKECPNFFNVYTLNIQRQPEVTLGDNAELKNLTITNHDEFKYERNVLEYNLILKKNEDKLDINYEKELESTQCDITGNEDLGYSSEVIIRCVSEDGEDIVEYSITIDGVEKGTNIFFIIILVIIIVLILIYLVLRLLGYRIYFNFGSLFRGMNEKVKNVFDN